MRQNIRMVMSAETARDLHQYYLDVTARRVQAGAYLREFLNGVDLSTLTFSDFFKYLMHTKRAVKYAERDVVGNGTDWNTPEIKLLSNVGILATVRTFSNGVWGRTGWEQSRVYKEDGTGDGLPFDQIALVLSAPLLKPGLPDYDRVVRNGRIDPIAYYELIEERFLPLLLEAQREAERANTSLILAVTGLGCGAFAQAFRGQVGEHLAWALQKLLERHHTRLSNVRVLSLNTMTECQHFTRQIGNTSFRIRPMSISGQNGEVFPPQLSPVQDYQENGEDFSAMQKAKAVAGDFASHPNNEGSRGMNSTDDGAFGCATNMASILTNERGLHSGVRMLPTYMKEDGNTFEATINGKSSRAEIYDCSPENIVIFNRDGARYEGLDQVANIPVIAQDAIDVSDFRRYDPQVYQQLLSARCFERFDDQKRRIMEAARDVEALPVAERAAAITRIIEEATRAPVPTVAVARPTTIAEVRRSMAVPLFQLSVVGLSATAISIAVLLAPSVLPQLGLSLGHAKFISAVGQSFLFGAYSLYLYNSSQGTSRQHLLANGLSIGIEVIGLVSMDVLLPALMGSIARPAEEAMLFYMGGVLILSSIVYCINLGSSNSEATTAVVRAHA